MCFFRCTLWTCFVKLEGIFVQLLNSREENIYAKLFLNLDPQFRYFSKILFYALTAILIVDLNDGEIF